MYMRMAITMLVGLYTSRVVLRVLGVEDYGLYNVIGGIIALFAVLNNALMNSTSRFVTVSLAKGIIAETRQTFNMAFLMHFAVALFLIVIGETVGLWYLHNKLVIPVGREFAAGWLYQFTIITAVLGTINVPYNACIVAHEKINVFAILQVIDAVLKLGIVYVIQVAPYDKLIYYAVLMLLVIVFNFLFNYIYCQRRFPEVKFVFYWSRNRFKEVLKFIGWALVGNFSNMFYTQGINLMLNAFCGPAVNAARGIAVQVQGVVAQMANNVQTAINPQILKTYAVNDLDRMHMLICASSRYCYYLLFLFSLPIMLEANFILHLWLGVVPEHTVNFIRLTLMTVLLDAFINPMFTANLASGRLNLYYIPVSMISVSFMFITYFAIKYTLMPESTFLCYLAMVALGVIIRVFVMRKQVKLNPILYIKTAILPAIVVTLLASALPVASHLLVQGNVARLFVTGIISVVSTAIVVCYVGITKLERQFVIQFVKNKLHRQFV
ncbi:MAG: lipopolysaccharide biosynthesis protein [Lentisphaerae bacterium]|nr:lipopolysaccharide biosynthesis protein [Lentisphaerota bacterium]